MYGTVGELAEKAALVVIPSEERDLLVRASQEKADSSGKPRLRNDSPFFPQPVKPRPAKMFLYAAFLKSVAILARAAPVATANHTMPATPVNFEGLNPRARKAIDTRAGVAVSML